jgi:hypothetical protein
VDVAAKEVARGTTSTPTLLPSTLKCGREKTTLPTSKSTTARAFTDKMKRLQKKIFEASSCAALTKKVDHSIPSNHYLKLVDNLPNIMPPSYSNCALDMSPSTNNYTESRR